MSAHCHVYEVVEDIFCDFLLSSSTCALDARQCISQSGSPCPPQGHTRNASCFKICTVFVAKWEFLRCAHTPVSNAICTFLHRMFLFPGLFHCSESFTETIQTSLHYPGSKTELSWVLFNWEITYCDAVTSILPCVLGVPQSCMSL